MALEIGGSNPLAHPNPLTPNCGRTASRILVSSEYEDRSGLLRLPLYAPRTPGNLATECNVTRPEWTLRRQSVGRCQGGDVG